MAGFTVISTSSPLLWCTADNTLSLLMLCQEMGLAIYMFWAYYGRVVSQVTAEWSPSNSFRSILKMNSSHIFSSILQVSKRRI